MIENRRQPWWDEARCLGSNPELFFPAIGEPATGALLCCNGDKKTGPCPVRAQCLQFALDSPDLQGVWGGVYFSADQRKRARMRKARKLEVLTEIIDMRPRRA